MNESFAELDVVLVDRELDIGIGRGRGAESERNPAIAEMLRPERVAPVGDAFGIVRDGLVDDVPRGQLVLVIGHDGVDVIDEGALDAFQILDLLGPVRNVMIPGERVAAHGQVVLLREIIDGVGALEGKGVRIRPQHRPFQLEHRHHLRAIGADGLAEPRIGLQIPERGGGAIARTALHKFRHRQRRRRCARRERCGAAEEKFASVELRHVAAVLSEPTRHRTKRRLATPRFPVVGLTFANACRQRA